MHPTCHLPPHLPSHLPPQVGDGCVIERSLLCNGVKVRALSLCNSLGWQHPRTYLQSFPLVLRQIGAGCVIAAGCVLSFGVFLVRPPCAMPMLARHSLTRRAYVHTLLTYTCTRHSLTRCLCLHTPFTEQPPGTKLKPLQRYTT